MELETIIGLEIHVQLNTRTKLFCKCDNDAFGATPNSRVCPVCMGFPGMLPVLNAEALEKGALLAAALNCEIKKFSKFDRKNYFYPDLPSGFQISQFDQPISEHGLLKIEVNGGVREIGITRAHLENDAGKLTHEFDGTLCDYNRAGTPLLEIVTEPDLRTPEEAQILAKEIQKIARFTNASNADMEKGMMRFDASISMRPKGEKKLYPRTEIKNLNSFTSLFKALKFEQKKQRRAWKNDEVQTNDTTVGWLDDREETQLLRDKESANDYRYFPEPDLPPVTFTEEVIEKIKNQIPELPLDKYNRYQTEFGLSAQEALKLSENVELYKFFEDSAKQSNNPKASANLILSVILADTNWENSQIKPKHLAEAVKLQKAGKVSSSAAKEIIVQAMKTGEDAESIMKKNGLEQKSDSGEIEKWVESVIAENPKVVEDICSGGKPKMIQFLMGQVMQKSKGQANPPMVMELLKNKLNV